MSKRSLYFSEFALHHENIANQRTHFLGIPMMVVAVYAWLSKLIWISFTGPGVLPFLRLDAGVLLVLLSSAWYVWFDWRLGSRFVPVLFVGYWIGRMVPGPWIWALFLCGWTLQFIGHAVFEKKSPAFLRNIKHMLVGPIWVFSKLFEE